MGVLRVGTSGWQYRDWRAVFYPPHVPARSWLGHYAQTFDTVELNNAFYRLPERATFTTWAAQVPDGFVMSVKASRYLTHIRRLRDPAEPVARLLDRLAGLNDPSGSSRLGPVLLQFPPTLPADAGLLDAVLQQFPPTVRVAVEPRHESWFSDPIARTLTDRGAALCWADRDGRVITPLWRTADFGYLRLHAGRARPYPHYGRAALRSWRRQIRAVFDDHADVFVYFNNDHGGAAAIDAQAMLSMEPARTNALTTTVGEKIV
jgi:uncharacterized protein YecE (DUF72 family)